MHDRRSRDPSGSPGDVFDEDLRQLFELIDNWSANLGAGRWQSAQEIEDELLRIVEDRYLKGTLPNPIGPWAFKTYENLVKSGPPRAGQRQHAELDSGCTADRREERIDIDAAWIDEFERVLPAAMGLLTEAEHRALEAIRAASTMSQAAELANMSPRHLRTRFWRIVGKIARLARRK